MKKRVGFQSCKKHCRYHEKIANIKVFQLKQKINLKKEENTKDRKIQTVHNDMLRCPKVRKSLKLTRRYGDKHENHEMFYVEPT